jgi:hypothetical protein
MGCCRRGNDRAIFWILPICVAFTGSNPEEWTISLAVDAPSL